MGKSKQIGRANIKREDKEPRKSDLTKLEVRVRDVERSILTLDGTAKQIASLADRIGGASERLARLEGALSPPVKAEAGEVKKGILIAALTVLLSALIGYLG